MIGQDEMLRIVERVLRLSGCAETEAVLTGEHLHLTRFNDNSIHQNLSRRNYVLRVRVVKEQRTGTAVTNRTDDDAIRWLLDEASKSADSKPRNPDSKSLPSPREPRQVSGFYHSTHRYTAAERADAAGEAITRAQARGLDASGAFSTGTEEIAVANSHGIRVYNASTISFFRTIMSRGEITGYADRLSRNVLDFDFGQIANEALEKALHGGDSIPIEPGEYDTIFEEYAVADLVRFLGYLAFGALAKQEGRSFMATQMGQKVMGENISIWDDAADPRGLVTPFDLEGVPKQKVSIINKGVAEGVVYDSITATKDGKQSTGHSTGYGGRWLMGPMPSHMLLGTGNVSREAMIRSTSRGILVTRFHYTHCPEPAKLVATGTTRDGTFLVENGEITRRLKNLRFTESVLRAFSCVECISSTSRVVKDWWSTFSSVLPVIKVKGFTFTGSTTF